MSNVADDDSAYMNPDFTADQRRHLRRINYLVLMTGQAALGLIGPGWRALAVGVSDQEIVVYAAVEVATDEIDDDLDDLVRDLDAFLSGGPEANKPIRLVVNIGTLSSSWPGGEGPRATTTRPVFMAKRGLGG